MSASKHPRKQTRYAADFELHIEAGGRSIVTRTRDVSEGGLFFFASSPPMVGDVLRLRLNVGDRTLALTGTVRYRLPEVGTGLELERSGDYAAFHGLVVHLARTSSAWHAINGFVNAMDSDKTPAPNIVEDLELMEIGCSCEALRLLFERHPAQAVPASHPFSRRLSGICTTAVRIQLHAGDDVREVFVGVLANEGGYAAILRPRDGKGEPTLFALRGRESITIAAGGASVFPHYTRGELKRISRDQTPAAHTGMTSDMQRTRTADLPQFPESELPDALTYWTRYDRRAEYALTLLFDQLEAETRVYKVHGTERAVRLLRDVRILVRGEHGTEETGIPFDDGVRVCVIVAPKNRPPTIRPLMPSDEICVPSLTEAVNGQVIGAEMHYSA